MNNELTALALRRAPDLMKKVMHAALLIGAFLHRPHAEAFALDELPFRA
jgi:hypothetical protein